MPVLKISTTAAPKKPPKAPSKKKPDYVKITGYLAAASGVTSAIAGSKKKIKLHKNLAYLAGVFTLAHIGILEWYKHKYKK